MANDFNRDTDNVNLLPTYRLCRTYFVDQILCRVIYWDKYQQPSHYSDESASLPEILQVHRILEMLLQPQSDLILLSLLHYHMVIMFTYREYISCIQSSGQTDHSLHVFPFFFFFGTQSDVTSSCGLCPVALPTFEQPLASHSRTRPGNE